MLVRQPVGERQAGRLGGREAIGTDVRREHRARRVGDQHDDRLVDLRGDGPLRARERDRQRADRQQRERRRDVAPPIAPGDAGEHRDGGIAHRVAATPALRPPVGHERQRDEHQRDQCERLAEAHPSRALLAVREVDPRHRHALEHAVEHPVGVDAVGQRLVGEHHAVAQHVARDVARQHVVAPAQQRQRATDHPPVDVNGPRGPLMALERRGGRHLTHAGRAVGRALDDRDLVGHVEVV